MKGMNFSIAATLILTGTAAAFFSSKTIDFSVPPRTAAEVETDLKTCAVTLTQAVQTAEKEVGGIAGSAHIDADAKPPVIEVVVYAQSTSRKVTIDSASGKVIDNQPHSRYPGQTPTTEPKISDTGMKYYVLKEGTGDAMVAPDKLLDVEMSIWLVDGTKIFASADSQKPARILPASYQIKGIVEALGGMKVGEKRKLLIPPTLALGPNAQGQIPPNAMLITDLELLAIPDYATVPAQLPGEPVTGEPVQTSSGLKYYDLVVGQGPKPAGPTSVVRVHYTGWLTTGEQFDSSIGRDPLSIALSGVIAGWTEGVGSMNVGGKRKLIIPSSLGYGPTAKGPIPAGATLIFDVELVEVVSN